MLVELWVVPTLAWLMVMIEQKGRVFARCCGSNAHTLSGGGVWLKLFSQLLTSIFPPDGRCSFGSATFCAALAVSLSRASNIGEDPVKIFRLPGACVGVCGETQELMIVKQPSTNTNCLLPLLLLLLFYYCSSSRSGIVLVSLY